eukprot:1073355-Pleurochrysis_carterae.AAC.2
MLKRQSARNIHTQSAAAVERAPQDSVSSVCYLKRLDGWTGQPEWMQRITIADATPPPFPPPPPPVDPCENIIFSPSVRSCMRTQSYRRVHHSLSEDCSSSVRLSLLPCGPMGVCRYFSSVMFSAFRRAAWKARLLLHRADLAHLRSRHCGACRPRRLRLRRALSSSSPARTCSTAR